MSTDSASPQSRTPTRRGDSVFRQFSPVAIGLVFLSLLLFAGTLGNGFVLDDTLLVRDNPRLANPSQTGELLTSDYWSPHRVSGLYRPLVTLSFAINAWIFGVEPASFHGVNALLHALNAVIVFGIFSRLSRDVAISIGAAVLFVTHAVHTEAVANVAGRAELLSAAFSLGAVWAYLVFLAGERGNRARSYALCLLLFGLALFCKENALTFIGVAALCDLIRVKAPSAGGGGDESRRKLVLRYAGIAAVAVVCFGVRFIVLPSESFLPSPSRLDNPLIELDAPLRIANALMVLQRYVGLLVLPFPLTYDYSYAQIPLAKSLTDPRIVLAAALTAAELGATLWLLRRNPLAFFGAAFFFVTMSVVANVIAPIGTIMAERLLYLPSVGFCLLAAVALRAAVGRGVVFAGAIALLATLHGVHAASRSLDWKSQERLYFVDLNKSPGSARVQSNAGFIEQERGEHRRALRFFARALAIEPRYEKAYVNAGVSYAALGEWEKAIGVFSVAVDLKPWEAPLQQRLAESLIAVARTEEAVPHLEAAARLAPKDEKVRSALARAYEATGHADWAQALYDQGVPREPVPAPPGNSDGAK